MYKEKVNKLTRIVFYYNCVYTNFGAGEYSDALEWLNKVLNDTTVELRHDILSYSRILNLQIHYELENDDLLAGK